MSRVMNSGFELFFSRVPVIFWLFVAVVFLSGEGVVLCLWLLLFFAGRGGG